MTQTVSNNYHISILYNESDEHEKSTKPQNIYSVRFKH